MLAGLIAARVGLDLLVRFAMLTALAGAVLFAGGFKFGLAVVGLGLAPVFPCLMARTPERLGEATAAHAVGFQVSAGMLGAALMPGAAGIVGERFGLPAVGYFAVTIAVLLFATHELLLTAARRRS